MSEMRGAGYFLMTPTEIARDPRVKSKAELVIYAEVFTFKNAQPDGKVWMSNETFSERTGIKKNAVSKAIGRLVELGYLRSELTYKPGTKQVDRRYLEIAPLGVETNTPLASKPIPPWREDQYPIGVNDKDNISINKSINKSKKTYVISDETTVLIQKINSLSGKSLATDPEKKIVQKADKMIKRALNEYSMDDLVKMVEYKWSDWFDWNQRDKYFVPATLFNSENVDKYVQESQMNKAAKAKKTVAAGTDWDAITAQADARYS